MALRPVVAGLAVSLALPVLSAHALVVPPMGITVSTTNGLTVCGAGHPDTRGNSWVMTVQGVRDDGTRILETRTGNDPGFHACVPIVMGTTTGGGTITLTYAGAYSDAAGHFEGYFGWSQATGPFGGGTGIV